MGIVCILVYHRLEVLDGNLLPLTQTAVVEITPTAIVAITIPSITIASITLQILIMFFTFPSPLSVLDFKLNNCP
jgi:hypothetical protein